MGHVTKLDVTSSVETSSWPVTSQYQKTTVEMSLYVSTARKMDVAVKVQVKDIDYLPNGKLTFQVIIQAALFT